MISKQQTPGLQALLHKLDIQNLAEEAELVRQIKLIKSRFKQRNSAKV